MSLTAAQVRLLAAKGLSALDIADVMDAGDVKSEASTARRRAADRDRKAKQRAKDRSRRTTADTEGKRHADSHADKADKPLSPQKKVSPPPSKKTPPSPDLAPLGPRERPAIKGQVEEMTKQFKAVFPKWIGGAAVANRLRILSKKRDFDFAAILVGAERYAQKTRDEPERFVVAPEKWLRDGRWADEDRKAAPIVSDGPPRPGRQADGKWWFEAGSPEFAAHEAHRRRVEGRGYPTDKFNGWKFDAEKPPPHLKLLQA